MAPAESVETTTNFCLLPAPDAGVTETGCGPDGATSAVAVHVPRMRVGETWLLKLWLTTETFFVPAKAALK